MGASIDPSHKPGTASRAAESVRQARITEELAMSPRERVELALDLGRWCEMLRGEDREQDRSRSTDE